MASWIAVGSLSARRIFLCPVLALLVVGCGRLPTQSAYDTQIASRRTVVRPEADPPRAGGAEVSGCSNSGEAWIARFSGFGNDTTFADAGFNQTIEQPNPIDHPLLCTAGYVAYVSGYDSLYSYGSAHSYPTAFRLLPASKYELSGTIACSGTGISYAYGRFYFFDLQDLRWHGERIYSPGLDYGSHWYIDPAARDVAFRWRGATLTLQRQGPDWTESSWLRMPGGRSVSLGYCRYSSVCP